MKDNIDNWVEKIIKVETEITCHFNDVIIVNNDSQSINIFEKWLSKEAEADKAPSLFLYRGKIEDDTLSGKFLSKIFINYILIVTTKGDEYFDQIYEQIAPKFYNQKKYILDKVRSKTNGEINLTEYYFKVNLI